MRYTAELLVQHLKKAWPDTDVVKNSKQAERLNLFPLEDYSGQNPCLSGRAYLCTAKDFPHKKEIAENCVIVSIGRPHRVFNPNAGCYFIFLPEDAAARDVFQIARECDETYRKWGEALQEARESRKGIQCLLEVAYPLFGNPLLFSNDTMQFIAAAGTEGMYPNEQVSQQMILGQKYYFISESEARSKAQSTDMTTFYNDWIFHYKNPSTGIENISAHIIANKNYVGTLSVLAVRRSFVPADYELLEYLGQMIMRVTEDHGYYNQYEVERIRIFFSSLIAGDDIPQEKAESMLRTHGFKADAQYVVFCIETANKIGTMPIPYISYQLEGAHAGSISLGHNGSPVLIVNVTRSKNNIKQICTNLTEIFQKHNLFAGRSDVFCDLRNIKEYYTQANHALKSGLKQTYSGEYIFAFRSYALSFMLHCIRSNLPTEMICAEGVLRLYEHDKTSTVSYCNSLKVYLQTGMNAAKSAQILQIRRNTFISRIGRILKLLDMDINDSDMRLYLDISLRMLD